MGKWSHSDVIDASLNYVKNNAKKMIACSAQPATFEEATTVYKLAEVAMVPEDFAVGAGDISGRKVTVGAKQGVSITASGTQNHTALVDTINNKLLYVSTLVANQALVQGNTMDFGAWDIEIGAPQ